MENTEHIQKPTAPVNGLSWIPIQPLQTSL